jgi:asparagine synthase (glutamine-hydrolysing)
MPREAIQQLDLAPADDFWRISQAEARLYMRNTLLRDSDCTGMAHSLEIRVPMLDRRVIDYVFGLPGRVRSPDGRSKKHLLRTAFADLLPGDLMSRRKTGFTLPVGRWMAGPLREFCEHGLAQLKQSGLAEPNGIDKCWNKFLAGGDTIRWTRFWTLCVLGIYLGRRASRRPFPSSAGTSGWARQWAPTAGGSAQTE